jgi:large subunit ribosomal protein L44e
MPHLTSDKNLNFSFISDFKIFLFSIQKIQIMASFFYLNNNDYAGIRMKVPKTRKCYCPKCNKHTEHKVSIYKKGKERAKTTEGWRRYNRKKRGYGSQPKPIFKRNAKINKKTLPMYKCAECGRMVVGRAIRIKKFEIMTK